MSQTCFNKMLLNDAALMSLDNRVAFHGKPLIFMIHGPWVEHIEIPLRALGSKRVRDTADKARLVNAFPIIAVAVKVQMIVAAFEERAVGSCERFPNLLEMRAMVF